MTYRLDYDGSSAVQTAGDWQGNSAPSVPAREPRRFRVPGIVRTGSTILTAGAVFFAAEAFLPSPWKPSDLVGSYESRVESMVREAAKKAELEQQARYEDWAAGVKVSVEQQVERYKAHNQAVFTWYQAAHERGKIWAEATARIQTQFVDYRMSQTRAQQGTDVAIVNYARLFGRVLNLVDPGSGDGALGYADILSAELSSELTAAAANGKTITVEGWDTGLMPVEALRAEMAALKPITIPPPPKLHDDPTSVGAAR